MREDETRLGRTMSGPAAAAARSSRPA